MSSESIPSGPFLTVTTKPQDFSIDETIQILDRKPIAIHNMASSGRGNRYLPSYYHQFKSFIFFIQVRITKIFFPGWKLLI